jgi:NAD(P)-dependent dehydrogenase (short-subunit alcohol dehydrogenase family)
MTSTNGTILLTGANGGLGSAIVTEIVKKPELAAYTGVYTVRKAASATQLKQALNAGSRSHKHEIVDLDLSSLASVRKTATEINRRVAAGELPPIKALILNAAYQDHEELVSISLRIGTKG